MRKSRCRRFFIIAVIISFIMLFPARAAAFSIDLSISHEENGAACGELWLGGELFWRLLILPDGAKETLSAAKSSRTISLFPAIIDGMFVVSVK